MNGGGIRLMPSPMISLPSTLSLADDPFQMFASTVLSSGSNESALARLGRLGHVRTVRRGSPALLQENEDQFVFVARGATKLAAPVALGREQILSFHFAGDFALVPGRGAHGYTLCAISDCELIAFLAPRFLDAVKGDAPILAALFDRSTQALRRSRAEAIMLGRKSAQERVADFLVSMTERIGSPEGAAHVLELPMSRRDIADTLGLTIETVSRQMSELRLLGLIETSGRSFVRLLDLERLSARAGHLPKAA